MSKGDKDTRTPNHARRTRNIELIQAPTEVVLKKVSDIVHETVPAHDIQKVVDEAKSYMPEEQLGNIQVDKTRTWAFMLLKAVDRYERNL